MEKKLSRVRSLLLLSAGILTAGLLSWNTGQPSPDGNPNRSPGADGAEATPHTLLWKISGKGLARPSYLFGTMHILCAQDAMLSDSLKSIIASCDRIWFEIDLSDMSNMMGAMKYMRMNDSKKLSDLLDPADYKKVKDYFAQHSAMLPFGMLERFKPMLISSIIEENNMACKSTDGMELLIMKEAQYRNKPISGLETAEFQAGLFDSIPYEKQAKELVNSIDSMDQYKQQTLDLAAVYKQQDLDKIDEMSRKDDPGMEEYMDMLLYARNRKWVKELDTLLYKGSLLVAVGAAHLPGEQGVINLLRKEGYTVTPVKD